MKALLNFFFPPRCLLCGESQGLLVDCHLCAPCSHDFSLNLSPCGRCGVPMPLDTQIANRGLCGQCLVSAPAFDYCWSPFIYAQPLEWMIHQFKFNAKLIYSPVLSSLMIQQLPMALRESSRADAIIPMPLHSKRLKQRGFNQSLLLARPLARALNIKIDCESGQRVRNTEHQTGKSAKVRRQNIKGAFHFDNKQGYEHLIIFDDVVTTGSSVSEFSKVLKQSGVKRVDVYSLARAEKIN